MIRGVRGLLMIGLAVSAVGCAAGGAGGGGGPSGYSQNLGSFEPDQIISESLDYIQRLSYDVEVNNGVPAILIQTFWRNLRPTDLEREAGVTEVRNRIRVLGRQRMGTATSTNATEFYVATFQIERQVRMGNGEAWQERPAAPDFLEWARTSARELQLQLESGRRD